MEESDVVREKRSRSNRFEYDCGERGLRRKDAQLSFTRFGAGGEPLRLPADSGFTEDKRM